MDEADLDWYDYGYRNYDAQIGRFPQADPLMEGHSLLSPYHYATNDPVSNVDAYGLLGIIATTAGEAGEMTSVVVVGYKAAKTAVDVGKLALNITGITVRSVITVSGLINISFQTPGVGGDDLIQGKPGQGLGTEWSWGFMMKTGSLPILYFTNVAQA